MAFARPTLPELVARIEPDFVSRLQLAGALLRRSVTRVLARVLAGASHGLHGHIAWAARQVFPDTADQENLLRWGRLYAIEPLAPTFATGSVVLSGTNGNVAPAGSVLLRADGVQYTTDADATIAMGTATVDVTASVADANSNCDIGMLLAFQSPIVGIDASAQVNHLDDGTDEETPASYLLRVLDRMQNAPHGGNPDDYVQWTLEVPGVTRAWVYSKELGAGTVVVRFMRDNDVGSPFPDGGEVADVQAYLVTKAPVTATVTGVAPTAVTVNYTLAVVPNTQETKNAVTAELTDLHQRITEPGVDLLLTQIRTSIGVGVGTGTYTLASPTTDVTATTGQLPALGTITFT